MIRAITAARMIMTVVMLFGENRKDNITAQPTSFTPYAYAACLQSCQQEGEVEAGKSRRPRAGWTGETHDHSSDKHSGEHLSSKVKDRVTGGKALPLGGGSGSQWRMLLSASPGA